jgi:hypothetical protein
MKSEKKLMSFAVVFASLLAVVQSAQAREHVRHSRHYGVRDGDLAEQNSMSEFGQNAFWQSQNAYGVQQHIAYSGREGGRPAAWCGWQMRQLVSSDPGPSFNLARKWAHWGRSGPAGVGAVVVWPHHVGKIVGQQNGEWLIESGNDGHALRTRARSIAGVIAIRWG